MTQEILRQLILDSQEQHLHTGVPRRLLIETVGRKATVLMGVRRSGKSTYLFQIIDSLLKDGVSRENILFINFFDDRLHELRRGGLDVIADAFFSLYPEKKGKEKIYCFFDEIQAVDGWEPFVDRLLRTENCDVYLTGSSAQMLSREIATQMRGRALSWEVFPFSFPEYLDFKGVKSHPPFSTREALIVRKVFDEYWESGGFPEVAGLTERLRVRIHQEYLQSILFRDLVERHDVSHPRAVSDLTHKLLENVASLYSINSLTGYLKSLGHKVPKSSVSDYMEWFQDSYFLFTVKIFDASLNRRQANPKKIYAIDHALVRSASSGILVNAGHLLENLVFIALRRLTSRIHYYKTSTSREVDFIALLDNREKVLVQVCESLADPNTRKREIRALSEAMTELDLPEGQIVTRDEEETIEVEGRTVKVVPVWKFLISGIGT